MKRIISVAIICLAFVQLIAQNLPQGIAYQAVAVKDGPYSIAGQNPQAIYWSNKDINVRFTIYEKYPGGSAQYSESHSTKTDDYGVFNLIIGQGNLISGDFAKIPWDLGTAHLQVEIDFDNNGTYKLTSLERFWSVPYAFVTRKNSSSTDSALNALNSKFNYLKNRDKDTVIGNEGGVSYKSLDSLNKILVAKLAALKASDKDTVIGNEWQKLTRNKDTLILSDGGGKVTLLDEDPMNELQLLTRSKDTVSLSQNGGNFVLNDDDPKNEIQVVVRQIDTITLSQNGGKFVLNDDDPKNEIQVLVRQDDTITLSQNGGKFILNDDDPKNELQSLRLSGDTLSISNGNNILLPRVGPATTKSLDSFSWVGINKSQAPTIYSQVIVPTYTIGWQWYSIDLGNVSVVLTTNQYGAPESILTFDDAKKELKKTQSIGSTGATNTDVLPYYLTPDKLDTTFLGWTPNNFWIYNVKSNSFNKFGASSKYSSFFNSFVPEYTTTSPWRLKKIAKFKDTIVLISLNKNNNYNYIHRYSLKGDSFIGVDSLRFEAFVGSSGFGSPVCRVIDSENVMFLISSYLQKVYGSANLGYNREKMMCFNTKSNKAFFINVPYQITTLDGYTLGKKCYLFNSKSIVGHLNLSNYSYEHYLFNYYQDIGKGTFQVNSTTMPAYCILNNARMLFFNELETDWSALQTVIGIQEFK